MLAYGLLTNIGIADQKSMVLLEIRADILTNKYFEFSQSKLAFINDLQKANGYLTFTEKLGEKFDIRISWADKKSLKLFMDSENFHFFRGAILTLGKPDTIIINKVESRKKVL